MIPPPSYSEQQLFSRIAEGDEAAFAEIYKLYVPQLFPFIKGYVKSEAIADEIIQETFLRVWISRDKLTEILEPKAWVFKIASNICYTHIRRHILERNIIEKMSKSDSTSADEVHLQAQAGELMDLVQKAIEQLTPQRKKVYRLSREAGMTIPQMAEMLDLSPSTVKNTLVTSLQQIREYLKERGYSLPTLIITLLFFKNL